jgi:hypothetical protein
MTRAELEDIAHSCASGFTPEMQVVVDIYDSPLGARASVTYKLGSQKLTETFQVDTDPKHVAKWLTANAHDLAAGSVDAAMNETTPGLKHDGGKTRYDLVPFDALEQIAKVLTYGAAKYGPNNWRHVVNEPGQNRYLAAILRHVSAYARGEIVDQESGLPHLAHAACSCLFLLSEEARP